MRLTDTQLREFRRDVARLKKEGLIPAKNRNGNKVLAKSARPEQLVHGKRLIDYIRDKPAREVLKGEAVTIARSRVKDTQGFAVRKPGGMPGRVIIPAAKDAKITIEDGNIVTTHESETGSISHILLPRKNLRQYLRDAESLPPLKGGDRYAFYIFGHKSHMVTQNADQLVEYLVSYKDHGTFDTDDDGEITGGRKNANVFKHLEIVRINRFALPGWRADVNKAVRKSRQGGRRKKENRRMANIHDEFKKQRIRAKNREYMKRYRANKGKK